MNLLYIDPVSGFAGDMALGAAIDAGAPVDRISEMLESLGLGGYEIEARPVKRSFIDAVQAVVHVTEPQSEHRHYGTIRDMVSDSALPERAKSRALAVFEKIAAAEAKVHGTTVEKVHFHEVGAIDSIVDVAGFACALEILDVDKIYSGPIRFGTGSVECEHGVIPVPAPATVEIARGRHVIFTSTPHELTTPTGAGIICGLTEGAGAPEDFTIRASGSGAGSAEIDGLPNVSRIFLGESAAGAESGVVVLEANVDDASPELLGHLFEKLLASGALDVYMTPVQMKKSRPGTLLSVIAREADADALEEIMFREGTTFGIRKQRVGRTVLDRRIEERDTPLGKVKVKIGSLDGRVVAEAAEYESARALAEEKGVPLKEIYRLAGLRKEQ